MSSPFTIFFVRNDKIVGKATGNAGQFWHTPYFIRSLFESFDDAISWFEENGKWNYFKDKYTKDGKSIYELEQKYFTNRDDLINFDYSIIPRLNMKIPKSIWKELFAKTLSSDRFEELIELKKLRIESKEIEHLFNYE